MLLLNISLSHDVCYVKMSACHYTSSELHKLDSKHLRLNQAQWEIVKELGINRKKRTRRGCRAGRRKGLDWVCGVFLEVWNTRERHSQMNGLDEGVTT
ncbi:uncharacterized protein LOC117111016 isoform X2 [Anneissia japonica]|uniref:uncharacterized protein LOC117111016 isoform X2 n=1 Tax=Anneissia japonica TaxID=1529436 RepID=UPI0014257B32|nr:uncharacterized protein LOC117111016 isoform X2 [Anneissia japonica]